MRLFYLSAVAWFLADQLSKWLVLHAAGLLERGVIEVVPPFLVFRLGYNTGINFGLFAGGPEVTRWVLTALALAISAWLWWWARKGLDRPLALVSAGAVIGGALGNALDRVRVGAVVDFLNMSCCGIQNPFAFNVADVGIVLGALGLLFFADGAKNGS
jgi:signal peptidase II